MEQLAMPLAKGTLVWLLRRDGSRAEGGPYHIASYELGSDGVMRVCFLETATRWPASRVQALQGELFG